MNVLRVVGSIQSSAGGWSPICSILFRNSTQNSVRPSKRKRTVGCAYELTLFIFQITFASSSKTPALLPTRLLFRSAYYIYISRTQVLTQENLRNPYQHWQLLPFAMHLLSIAVTQNLTILFTLSIFMKHSLLYRHYRDPFILLP